ncbi:hypothetical protein KL935_004429 [Ogataea polymorpha]|nr:hypothetical protein KL908_001018 [Ogataea polymorpha]KAG7898279.1 hypothetical protein KL935_004429 [Ogataea polymorpha]
MVTNTLVVTDQYLLDQANSDLLDEFLASLQNHHLRHARDSSEGVRGAAEPGISGHLLSQELRALRVTAGSACAARTPGTPRGVAVAAAVAVSGVCAGARGAAGADHDDGATVVFAFAVPADARRGGQRACIFRPGRGAARSFADSGPRGRRGVTETAAGDRAGEIRRI